MAYKRFVSIVLGLAAMAALTCGVADASPDGDDISVTLDSLQIKLNWLDYRVAQEKWVKALEGRSDSLDFFVQLRQATTADERTFNTLRGARGRITDETEQRLYDLVYPEVLLSYVNSGRNIDGVYDSLTGFFDKDRFEFNGEFKSAEYLRRLLDRSDVRSDRESAYRALNAPGEVVVGQVGQLFRLRNQTAKRFGYNNYFALSESAVDRGSSDYLTLVSRVDSVSRDAYQDALAKVRGGSRDEAFEIWDWNHAFAGTWQDLDRYLPADSQMNLLKRSLADMGFDLDNSPIYFHEIGDTLAPPYSRLVVINQPNDVRVVCNLANGVESMRALFRAAGEAIRATEASDGQGLLGRKVAPAWSMGIGRFFEDLCLQPDWLRTYAHVPENLIGRVTDAKRGEELLRLRLLLTNAMFEYEAYRNPNTDLNALWWELFDRYTSLPRNEDLQPWAVRRSFVVRPLNCLAKLQAEIIAAQTIDYLQEQYGSIVGNTEVRSFLEFNYFRFGGKYPWQDLIERGTGVKPSPAFLAEE